MHFDAVVSPARKKVGVVGQKAGGLREKLAVAIPVIFLAGRTVGRTVREIIEPRALCRVEYLPDCPVVGQDFAGHPQIVV